MLRLKDIHHVVYRHRDLDAVERFFTDFGMVVSQRDDDRLYLRGTGPAPYVYVAERAEAPSLGAIAFEVERAGDLEVAAALPDASRIERLDAPGGGRRVVLTDPGGRRIELLYGVERVAPLPMRAALTFNTCDAKLRRGELQRPPKGPAQVLRLGHAALGVGDLKRHMDWYASTLGLLPSDYIVEPGTDHPVAVFMRVNSGDRWTDHHTVAMFSAAADHVHHVSFEVQDLDAQQLGHQWLRQRGWSPVWGVGRHVLGSQIFDYWADPSGNIVEHFTDGDLLTAAAMPGRTAGGDDSLYTWGPDMTVGRFLDEALKRSGGSAPGAA
jgi:catechol 2,3-dioxygenase-like lactoylglutathione lyase family enzyme